MERIACHTPFLELRAHQIEQNRTDLAAPVVRMRADPRKAAASIRSYPDRSGESHHRGPVRRNEYGIRRLTLQASLDRSLPATGEQCLHERTQRLAVSGVAQPEQNSSGPVILDSFHDLLAKFKFGKRRFHKQTHRTSVAESLIQEKRIGRSLHVDAGRERDRISLVTDPQFRTATSRQKFSRGIQELASNPLLTRIRIDHQHAQVAGLSGPRRNRQSKPDNPGVHPCNKRTLRIKVRMCQNPLPEPRRIHPEIVFPVCKRTLPEIHHRQQIFVFPGCNREVVHFSINPFSCL